MFWEKISRYFVHIAFEPSMAIYNCVIAVSIVLLLRPIEKKSKAIVIAVLNILGIYAALTILNGLYFALFNAFAGFSFTQITIILVYAAVFCRYNLKSKIIMCCTFFAAASCLSQFSGIVPQLVSGIKNAVVLDAIIRNVFVVFILGIVFFQKKFSMEKHEYILTSSVILISVYSLLAFILSLFCRIYLWGSSFNLILFSFITMGSMVLIGLLTYYMVYRICQNHNLNMQLMAQKHMNVRDMEMMRLNQDNLESMRKIRHEIKNQFAYMRVMLEKNNYEELIKYFQEIEHIALVPLTTIECGNEKLNTILNLELARAQSHGVSLDAKLMVPKELPFKDSDICSLLTNLIDNAIEACVRYNYTNATVEVGISQKNNTLYICTTNPVYENETLTQILSSRTTKKDSTFHGYGNKIIDKIVAAYNGQIKRSIESGKFIVDIMLDMDVKVS